MGVVHWVLAAVLLGCTACSGSSNEGDASSSSALGCKPDADLKGAPYDLSKSRFALGSTPVREDTGTIIRCVGMDGVVAIWPNGSELGVMNAGAPESALPDWSSDPAMLQSHVQAYFTDMGVEPCQVAGTAVHGDSSGDRTIPLMRSIAGIVVAESIAYARMNNADQSTAESLWWPTIPSETVNAARAWNVQLQDPAAMAAYIALLPAEAQTADAQSPGQVVIHHSSSSSSMAFTSGATFDIQDSAARTTLSFDAHGNAVSDDW